LAATNAAVRFSPKPNSGWRCSSRRQSVPALERKGFAIGAVEDLQGISWQKVTLGGVANHVGTTP
jgi:hypothetical protein